MTEGNNALDVFDLFCSGGQKSNPEYNLPDNMYCQAVIPDNDYDMNYKNILTETAKRMVRTLDLKTCNMSYTFGKIYKRDSTDKEHEYWHCIIMQNLHRYYKYTNYIRLNLDFLANEYNIYIFVDPMNEYAVITPFDDWEVIK